MSAVIRVRGIEATLEGKKWQSENATLGRMLNSFVARWQVLPNDGDNPEATWALRVVALLDDGKGVEVVSLGDTEPLPDAPSGVVF